MLRKREAAQKGFFVLIYLYIYMKYHHEMLLITRSISWKEKKCPPPSVCVFLFVLPNTSQSVLLYQLSVCLCVFQRAHSHLLTNKINELSWSVKPNHTPGRHTRQILWRPPQTTSNRANVSKSLYATTVSFMWNTQNSRRLHVFHLSQSWCSWSSWELKSVWLWRLFCPNDSG